MASSKRVSSAVWVSCVLCAFAMLVVPSAAFNPVGSAEAAPAETTLTIGSAEQLTSLNPFIGVVDIDFFFYSLVYDSLTSVDEDMNITPNLALSWNIVPDALPYGSVWQYNLTHNAYWHDGEPFTADDVNFTINYQTGANFATMWAYQPYTILIDHAAKVDEYTVRLHFKNLSGAPAPCAFGDKLMMPIMPMHIWSLISPADASFSFENPFPIGTGPLMCTANTSNEFNDGSSVVLLKNPNYHAGLDFGKVVQFDKLRIKFYLERWALTSDFLAGAIDVAQFDGLRYDDLLDYIAMTPGVPISTYAGLKCTSYSKEIEVNMHDAISTNPLRLDPEVRKAMAHATDKARIRDDVYRYSAQTGSSLLSPIYGDLFWEPSPTQMYEYDLALANQTLDAAGYTWNTERTVRVAAPDNPYNPNGELSFTILIMQSMPEDYVTANILEYDWARVGIDLTFVMYDLGQWAALVYSYSYDLAMSYWSGDPDPNYLLFTQTSYAINSWSENAYQSAAYDENYTISIESINTSVRSAAILNMEKLMYRDAALLVTVYPYGCYGWRTDDFSGWGDWSAHPGRSIDNYWGANPLLFDLVPIPPQNIPPTASFTVAPLMGDTTTMFVFDASNCTDPEDPMAALEVRWDWDNDGEFDTSWSTMKAAAHEFPVAGSYTVVLDVRDTDGLNDTATVDIVVTEQVIPEFGAMPLVMMGVAVVAVLLGKRGRSRD
jgi:peptide/nickel transport system substrate-binding protein